MCSSVGTPAFLRARNITALWAGLAPSSVSPNACTRKTGGVPAGIRIDGRRSHV
jgi:hypothetical protein